MCPFGNRSYLVTKMDILIGLGLDICAVLELDLVVQKHSLLAPFTLPSIELNPSSKIVYSQ